MQPLFSIAFTRRWLLLAALLMARPGWADAACEAPATTTEGLVQQALTCNPAQQAYLSRHQAAQHRSEASGRLDDPRLSVGVAPNTFGNDQLDDGYIVELSQPLPWPGTLSLDRQLADDRVAGIQAMTAHHQVELARQLRLALARRDYRRQRLAINRENQRLWQLLIDTLEDRYASVTASRSALLQAQHERHLLMENAIQLEAALERDSSQIRQALNLPTATALPDLSNDGIPAISDDQLTQRLSVLDEQPQIRALQAEQSQKQHELERIRKQRYPNFSLMTRYNSLWMNEDQRWVVGVGINLPLDQGGRSRQEAALRADQQALDWEQRDRLLALREQLAQAASHYREAGKRLRLYANELLPLARENLAASRDAFRSGEADFQRILTAQRQLLTTQEQQAQAYYQQRTGFAQLTAAAGLVFVSDWQSTNHSENGGHHE
ncbi:TolC family protein [Alcanivorax sp.]|uniref:TolC family protein n=1 Tax=Alcanivorax sp. TaxID=1872427 RepID=UPI0025BF81E1|nr:TolC family protein [Alcanivorax sp.]